MFLFVLLVVVCCCLLFGSDLGEVDLICDSFKILIAEAVFFEERQDVYGDEAVFEVCDDQGTFGAVGEKYRNAAFSLIFPLLVFIFFEDVEADDNSISIYPNPTTGMLNISFDNAELDGYSVEIYDALGRLVSAENVSASYNHTMDISAYPEGLYIVRISTSAFVANKKIMLTK